MTEPLVLHRGLSKGRCKSCGAEIVWCFTTAGKKSPFVVDAQGHWTIENGTAKFLGAPPTQLELGAPPQPDRYTSHFSECPNASEWRKKK